MPLQLKNDSDVDLARELEELKDYIAEQQTHVLTLQFIVESLVASQFIEFADSLERLESTEERILKHFARYQNPEIPSDGLEYLRKTMSEQLMHFFKNVRGMMGEKQPKN